MTEVLPTIGKYQLLERLGRGGAAEVYKAFNPTLERVVAIKLLHAHLAEAPDFISRFLREARVVALLRHAHIVQVFDFDTDGERPYMVMEYLPGNSLKARLDEFFQRDEHLPWPEVLRLFDALLDAVAYAHAQGMIHRDLKPANILLDSGGRPVLTDFGIARLLGGDRLTATGVVVGTPAYMSPEQGQGVSADERSDLYALGIVLFECLTGNVPFEADTAVALLLKHIHQPVPPLRELRPDLPLALEQVVTRALAKDPAERYQTAADLWQALAAVPAPGELLPASTPKPELVPPKLEALTKPEVRPTRPGTVSTPRSESLRQRLGGLALLLVLLAALIGAGFFVTRQAGAPTAAEQAVATAGAWLAAGNAQLAADAYSAILDTDPTNVVARYGRARAYEQLGLVEEALADLNTLLVLAPDDSAGYAERARLNVQYGLAEAPAILADFDRALALALPEDAAPIHFLRGWAILNFPLAGDQPNPAQALPNLRAAVELAPSNAEYHFTLARALLANEQPADALPPANRAVELDPAAALHRKLRAHIQFAVGDLYAALDDLAAAIEREPMPEGAATLYAERAYLQHRLDRTAAAAADLAEAQRLSPTAPLVIYAALLLDPNTAPLNAGELSSLESLAPDDPIWRAIFQELRGEAP